MLAETSLMRGIAALAGLDCATTDESQGFEAFLKEKTDAALKAVDAYDFAYIHIQKLDDLSHELDAEGKKCAIEAIDTHFIQPFFAQVKEPYSAVIVSDHYTFSDSGGHGAEPAPFLLLGPRRRRAARTLYGAELPRRRPCDDRTGDGGAAAQQRIMQWTLNLSRHKKSCLGAGALKKLPALCAPLGDRIMIVAGGAVKRAGAVDALTDGLMSEDAECLVYTCASGEPTVESVDAAVQAGKTAGVDMVIGIGGGSALDTAKAAAAVLSNGGSVRDYLEGVGNRKGESRPVAVRRRTRNRGHRHRGDKERRRDVP